ncbi:MAG: GAF domain-containing protein [Actinomycetota bacterium]|nr:GAF domain-containing protein [Actinomycetota bacterium]
MPGLPAEIARTLDEIAELVVSEESLQESLRRVTELAKHSVPGCDAAGISLVVEGRPRTEAATDRVVFEVDLVQYEADEGPCLSAIEHRQAVRVDFVPKDERFVHFVEEARERGVLSSLSVPVALRGKVLGALNQYSRSPHGFDETSETVALVLAAQAAIAIAASELYRTSEKFVADLQREIEDRDDLAEATGILRVRQECSAEQAEGPSRPCCPGQCRDPRSGGSSGEGPGPRRHDGIAPLSAVHRGDLPLRELAAHSAGRVRPQSGGIVLISASHPAGRIVLVDHAPAWVSGSDELFAELVASWTWEQRSRRMYDRRVEEPRLTAWWRADTGGPLKPAILGRMRSLLSLRYGVELDSMGLNPVPGRQGQRGLAR